MHMGWFFDDLNVLSDSVLGMAPSLPLLGDAEMMDWLNQPAVSGLLTTSPVDVQKDEGTVVTNETPKKKSKGCPFWKRGDNP